MTRPDDIEHCCGAICDSARKQAYIEHLEESLLKLQITVTDLLLEAKKKKEVT